VGRVRLSLGGGDSAQRERIGTKGGKNGRKQRDKARLVARTIRQKSYKTRKTCSPTKGRNTKGKKKGKEKKKIPRFGFKPI